MSTVEPWLGWFGLDLFDVGCSSFVVGLALGIGWTLGTGRHRDTVRGERAASVVARVLAVLLMVAGAVLVRGA